MKNLILLLLTITTFTAYSQHNLKLDEKQIKKIITETHGENVTASGEFFLQHGKSLIYEIYIPITKEYVTLVYNINKQGICFQYLRLANIENFKVVQEYLNTITYKIDDNHYYDEDNIKWTLHSVELSDYFTLIAEY